VMNPANDVSGRVGFDDVSRVDVPDARTIDFHLRHRYAPFVTTVFGDGCGVLPAHILAREKTINDVSFNAAPVGTGPFRVVRWERGNRIELRRNDEYFMGKPKLESVTIELVSNEDAQPHGERRTCASYSLRRTGPSRRMDRLAEKCGKSAALTLVLSA